MSALSSSVVLVVFLAAPASAQTPSGWRAHDLTRPQPPVVAPGQAAPIVPPPADAVVLFDGTNVSEWRKEDGSPAGWVVRNGAMEAVPGAGFVFTRREFGDVQLHVEWAAPTPPRDSGQGRGNSGVFLMGQYEVQVLDSYHNETYPDGQAGAAFGQYPPLVNASLPPGEWQSYDIVFRRPRFAGNGVLLSPARLTAFQNGILIQDDVAFWGPTDWLQVSPDVPGKVRGPIGLQDHGNPVRYRNIWVRELPGSAASAAPPLPAAVAVPNSVLDSLVGKYQNGGFVIEIARRGAGLMVTLPDKQPQSLIPLSATEFALGATAADLLVTSGPGGRPAKVTFHMGDTRFDLSPAATPAH